MVHPERLDKLGEEILKTIAEVTSVFVAQAQRPEPVLIIRRSWGQTA
jgi:hypothetical protein